MGRALKLQVGRRTGVRLQYTVGEIAEIKHASLIEVASSQNAAFHSYRAAQGITVQCHPSTKGGAAIEHAHH